MNPDEVSPSRDQHLVRVRERELEDRVAELGDRLLDSETRAAELVRTRAELVRTRAELGARERSYQDLLREHERVSQALAESEQRRRRAEMWLDRINSSVSWRLTQPLRTLKRGVRGMRPR